MGLTGAYWAFVGLDRLNELRIGHDKIVEATHHRLVHYRIGHLLGSVLQLVVVPARVRLAFALFQTHGLDDFSLG